MGDTLQRTEGQGGGRTGGTEGGDGGTGGKGQRGGRGGGGRGEERSLSCDPLDHQSFRLRT